MPIRENFARYRYPAAFVVGVVLIMTLFFFPVFFQNKDLYDQDLTYFFQPLSVFLQDEILVKGRFPLWNPYLWSGSSQIAISSPNIFYPFQCLLILLPFSKGLALYTIVHQVISGLLSYALGRKLELSPQASLVFASLWVMNGFVLSTLSNFTLFSSAAWLPLILLSTMQIVSNATRKGLIWCFLLSCSVYLMITAGRPEIFVSIGIIEACFLLFCLLPLSSFADKTRAFGFVFTAFLAGMFMSAPVILPALEWLQLSPRGIGLDPKVVLHWSAGWYEWLGFVVARPLGDLFYFATPLRALVESHKSDVPIVRSTFLGVGAFALALLALSSAGWRWRLPALLGLSAFLITSSLGSIPFVSQIVEHYPIFAIVRFPTKLLIFPVFFLSLLAARGFDLFVTKEKDQRFFFLTAAACVLPAIVHLLLGIGLPQWLPALLKFPPEVLSAHWLEFRQIMLERIIQFGLALLPLLFFSRLGPSRLKQSIVGAALIAPLVVSAFAFDVHCSEKPFYKQASRGAQMYRKAQSAQEDNLKRCLYVYPDPMCCPSIFYERSGTSLEETYYQFERSALKGNVCASEKVLFANGYGGAETSQYSDLLLECIYWSSQNQSKDRPKPNEVSDYPLARFCQLAAVDYVFTQAPSQCCSRSAISPPELSPALFELIDTDLTGLRLYRVIHHQRRAYAVSKVYELANFKEMISAIQAPGANFLFPEQFASCLANDLLANNRAKTSSSPVKLQDFNKDDKDFERIKKFQDSGSFVEIETESVDPCVLVLQDQFYPGWTASIDGLRTEILRANVFSRAVAVPSGKHTVRFVYEPFSLFVGVVLSALTGIIYASVLILAQRRTQH